MLQKKLVQKLLEAKSWYLRWKFCFEMMPHLMSMIFYSFRNCYYCYDDYRWNKWRTITHCDWFLSCRLRLLNLNSITVWAVWHFYQAFHTCQKFSKTRCQIPEEVIFFNASESSSDFLSWCFLTATFWLCFTKMLVCLSRYCNWRFGNENTRVQKRSQF